MTDSQGKFEEAKGYREPKEIGNKKPEGMRKPQVEGSLHYLDSTQDVSFIYLPLLLSILSCFFCSIHADFRYLTSQTSISAGHPYYNVRER